MMKKVTLLAFSLLMTIIASAQVEIANPMQQKMPVDKNVRYGKLDNGMTYYIRHNKYPEKRADFYIAQNVGSMQEEDNQAGLAHFLEHMAFNGTKHFPKRKTMLNYLETIGAKFGNNVNAYTGFDETVYTLSNIPIVRQEIIDSTLLILHDWSSYIDLVDEEIDKERPIIKEEWRTRTGSQSRIWDKQLPVIFKGSKYADRMPIGKMEVVEGFDYQTIKDYYKKWYRPDLQAIIVVGDIDADKVEAQVKELFSTIKMPENATERIYHPVPDNDEPIISIVTDKEETASRITHYIKHDIIPDEVKQTEMGYSINLAFELASSMLRERLSDISKTAESPFNGSYIYNAGFFVSKSKDAWTTVMISKEGKEKESLATLIRETERAKQYGFTDSELERAKANMIKHYESAYNNREKQQNESYTQEYVNSFTSGEPIPGIEYEYSLVQRLLPTLTANVINGMMAGFLSEKNNVVTMTGPKKEGLVYPTEAEVLSIMKDVRAEEIEGYMEEIITEPLISAIPTAGEIVEEEGDASLDMTIWTLSNGIKVAVKKTTHKDDEIIMSSLAYGGSSLALDSKVYEASLANSVPYIGGIGNFNSSDLKKVLAGSTANVWPYIDETTQGIGGRSSIKDLETMLQLTYLHFTAPRKDEDMFANVKNMIETQIKNAASKPSFALNQYSTFAKYGYKPRVIPMTPEDVENLDYDAILDFYKVAFANPSSFIFTFVGSVDKEALKPLVETYLASLPAGKSDVTYNNENVYAVRKGKMNTVFEQEMIEPKTTAYSVYTAKLPYTLQTRQNLDALRQILDIVYIRTIREDEGGTYGVRVSTGIDRVPDGQATLTINFDTDPEKVAKLSPMIHAEVEKIATQGPEDADFQKMKEYSLKQLAEFEILNGYWKAIVELKLFYGEDSSGIAMESLRNITKEDIQKLANEFVIQGNKIEVIMNPLKK